MTTNQVRDWELTTRAAAAAHRAVEQRMHEVCALLPAWNDASTTPEQLRKVARAVGDFRHDLLCHFAWEECAGYMDPVLRHDPGREEQVRGLRQEHDAMRQEIDVLHHDAVAAGFGRQGDHQALARRLQDLLRRLHDHEARENALVQQVFYRNGRDTASEA